MANIIYYLGTRGKNDTKDPRRIFTAYNASQMAERLEGSSKHSVRLALSVNPPSDIIRRLDRYFEGT